MWLSRSATQRRPAATTGGVSRPPSSAAQSALGLPASVLAKARHGLAPQRVIGLGAPDALPRNVEFQSQAMGLSKRAVRLMLESVSEQFGEPATNLDITLDAPYFDTPALILHGANDQIAPPEAAERIAASWPGAQWDVFDGIGHSGVLRDDRVVERVLAFLG